MIQGCNTTKPTLSSSFLRCSDKDKLSEKVSPLSTVLPIPSGPSCYHHKISLPPAANLNLPPVDFIHVNSGRIELHPETADAVRHSWCGPQQMVTANNLGPHEKVKDKQDNLKERITELEKSSKDLPSIHSLLLKLKEDLSLSLEKQDEMASTLKSMNLRVNTLETHNKALANIILPTLMRLTKEKLPSNSSNCNLSQNQNPPTPPPPLMSTPRMSPQSSPISEKAPVIAIIPKITNASASKSPAKPARKTSESSIGGAECRIPRAFCASKGATTHPPKSTQNKNIPNNKPKSRLPISVRKSCSSSGQASPSSSQKLSTPQRPRPSTIPQTTPNRFRNSKSSALPITKPNKVVTTISNNNNKPTKVQVQNQNLPPTKDDEGYSTMSNGALDVTATNNPVSTTNPNSSTFTRPNKKKLGQSPPAGSNCGTWTKSKSAAPRTFATATVLQPASITRTKENVRIVRGIPHEIRFSSEDNSSTTSEKERDQGPILWEDSDDSDILFLPIEVSSSGSESTLVPYPYSRSSCTEEDESTTSNTLTPPSCPAATWESSEEQDLVQRWMRLEDMRNSPSKDKHDADHCYWSWDWDGIGISSSSTGNKETNKPHKDSSSVNSGTWTKKKSTKNKSPTINPEIIEINLNPPEPEDTLSICLLDSSSEDNPVATEFTPDFYKLTTSSTSGLEDKVVQTSSNATLDSEHDEENLFLQCQNCLEKISKLVSLHQLNSPTPTTVGVVENGFEAEEGIYMKQFLSLQKKHANSKEGSSSRWTHLSPNKTSPQGDKTCFLQSSTEDDESEEGLVSPSME